MVRNLKGKYPNAKVFFRIFPTENMKWDQVKISEDKRTIYCRCLQDFGCGYNGRISRYWPFKTDGVFYNEDQSEIYGTVMADTVQGYYCIYNLNFFASCFFHYTLFLFTYFFSKP